MATKLRITLIASNVDKRTGKFLSPNCFGEEKVVRLDKEVKSYIINEFYSDSMSDLPLAKIALKSYKVKGNKISEWEV